VDTRPALAVVTRPSGDVLEVSLWIDAGARDADPVQVATLATWTAARRGGPAVHGVAWPDTIEFSATCRKRDLGNCLLGFARALSARETDAAGLHALQQRLVEARRQNLARDPGRAADALALHALLGDQADGLLPLGSPHDDADANADAVQSFLMQHFGTRRALLVAAGDIDMDTLERAAASAFARAPAATKVRDDRALSVDESADVAVEVDDKTALSLALSAPDLDSAQAAAHAIEQRLARDALAGDVRGHVFVVRGGALALLRVHAREPLAVLSAAAHEIERLRREGPDAKPAPPTGEDLDALTRRLALRWATHVDARSSAQLALGAGMLVAGGRGDRVAGNDPDAPQRQSWQERARAAFAAGRAFGDPRTEGRVDASSASVVLENGAHVELRRRASEQVAVALRFARGAASEPPLMHGRTALLATAAATACAGLPVQTLADRLQALGARLEPQVDAESWGLLLTAPEASWQPALALALDCALHPALERGDLATARLRLRERLGVSGGPGELHALAAEWIAPGQPGALAPWGSPDRQASVGLGELRELWRSCRHGAAFSVAAVGPLVIESALGAIARRAAELPAAPATEPATRAQSGGTPEPPQPVDHPAFGLVLWQAPIAPADAAGGRAFAAVARAALAQTPEVSASWHAGGASADGGWAAVALSGPPTTLAGVVAQLRAILSSVPQTTIERAADVAFEHAERTRAANASGPSSEAQMLARAPFRPAPVLANRDAARALAVKLARAEPIWVPLR
jgi:predicted Zn-dependent peptidase